MIVKAEAFEDRGGTAFGGPGVDIGQTGLHLGDARGVVRRLSLVHQRGAFHIGGQNRFNQRHVRRRHLLSDATDLGTRGQADVACVK